MSIEQSAPHIYISALPFTDKRSLIRKTFAHLYTGPISVNMFGSDRQNGRLIMTLTRREDYFCSLAYSHDSRLLASGSETGKIRIWDTRIGDEVLEPLRSIGGKITCVAFAPNGRSLAYGSPRGVVYVWSLMADRVAPAQLFGHSHLVRCVVFSPDGSLIASASSDGSVRIWRSTTGQNTATMRFNTSAFILLELGGAGMALAYSPDGQILACSESQTIRLWHGISGEPIRVYDYASTIDSIAFSPDGTKLAVGGAFGIVLSHHQSGNLIKPLRVDHKCVTAIHFSPDGGFMVSAESGGTICLWKIRHHEDGHVDYSSTILRRDRCLWLSPHPVVLSPDGMHIACASNDDAIRILDVDGSQAGDQVVQAPELDLTSLAISFDLEFIVSGSSDSEVRVWNAHTGEPKCSPLLEHTDSVLSVAISPDGRLVASASLDHTVRLWSTETGNAVRQQLQYHDKVARVVIFSPDGQLLASGSDDGTVHIWQILTGQKMNVITLSSDKSVHTIAFSPDAQTVAIGTSDGAVQFWRVDATGIWIWKASLAVNPLILDYSVHTVHSIAFPANGPRIAFTCPDGVHVLDVDTCRIILDLMLPYADSHVTSVSISHDGRYIACGSFSSEPVIGLTPEPGVILLWDATTGTLVATLCGHERPVKSIEFASGGRSFVSRCSGNIIRVWDLAAALRLSRENPCNPIISLSCTEYCDESWLCGPSGELLLWVPEEYRSYIQASPCTMLIGKRRVVITYGDQELHAGKNWTACWRGNKLNPPSHAL